MKKVIVIPNAMKDAELVVTNRVVEKLNSLGITVYINEKYIGVNDVEHYRELPTDAELIIVIGGDGSVIDASIIAIQLGVPLLGINLGKVGYLATVDPDGLDDLCNLAEDKYVLEERMLLVTEKHSADGLTTVAERFAVNEIIISHDTYLGLRDVRVGNRFGDQVLYRADGLIFSTPQGSTAYALSAGGPIISHQIDSITLTPVCPHSFFNRSIVFSPDDKLCVTNMGQGGVNISIDGRPFDSLDRGDSCYIYRSDSRVKMLSFGYSNLFSTLSQKIKLLHDLV